MIVLYLIVGCIGLVVSSVVFVTNLIDNKNLTQPIFAWGFFFSIASAGAYMADRAPPPIPISPEQLARVEYNRCLEFYDEDDVSVKYKITQEELCSNLNVVYKTKILNLKVQP